MGEDPTASAIRELVKDPEVRRSVRELVTLVFDEVRLAIRNAMVEAEEIRLHYTSLRPQMVQPSEVRPLFVEDLDSALTSATERATRRAVLAVDPFLQEHDWTWSVTKDGSPTTGTEVTTDGS